MKRIYLILILLTTITFAKSPPPGTGEGDVPANVLIMLDTSGSMGGSRINDAKTVIKKIVSDSSLVSGANFGLIQWHSYAKLLVEISSGGAKEIFDIANRPCSNNYSSYTCSRYQSYANTYYNYYIRYKKLYEIYKSSYYKNLRDRYKYLYDYYNSRVTTYCGSSSKASLCATGGTVLDSAMNLAKSYLLGSNSPINKNASCQKTILIVISDGAWTDRNASNTAKELYDNYGIQTFVVGFNNTSYYTGSRINNYNRLAQNGGTYPDSPLFTDNWNYLYSTLSSYIRQAINSRLTYTTPVIMPSASSGDFIYQSTFDYKKDHQWKGRLKKYELNSDGTIGLELWDAGIKLNNLTSTSRNIWTQSNLFASSYNNFTTGNLTYLKNLIYEGSNLSNSSSSDYITDADARNLINFIRGIDSYDEDEDGNYSEERWKLGDIYHSELAIVGPPSARVSNDSTEIYTEAYYRGQKRYELFQDKHKNRKEVVYAGSNDGMLHAFLSKTGEELWGFVPPNILKKLQNLKGAKSHTSNSIYAIDGSPVVKDIYYDGSWKTVLLCGLGAGGNGYFALDITDPDNPIHLFSFLNDPNEKLVYYWDENGKRDDYDYSNGQLIDHEFNYSKLGEAWSIPHIINIKTASGYKWVAVFSAGLNSGINADVGSAIFVIDLENNGKILERIDLLDDTSNNVANSVPTTLTLVNQDATTKASYAGYIGYVTDIEGKTWKINLSEIGNLYEVTQLFNANSDPKDMIELFSYNKFSPTIASDGNLWGYYGTGNKLKIQEMFINSSSKYYRNKAFGLKDKYFPAFNNNAFLNYKNIWDLDANSNCPSSDYQGWFFRLDPNEKTTGDAAVSNRTVYYPRYRPNKSNICSPGTARVTAHDILCGNTLYDIDLGGGVPGSIITHKNKIYLGVSGASSNKTLPDGWTRKDNIVVGTPPAGRGTKGIESIGWKEIFE